jgi:hypothetical protein
VARIAGPLLADTSAWHRSLRPKIAPQWARELAANRIATTPPVRLELLFSTRSAKEYAALRIELDALQQMPCGDDAFARALDVQARLARRGALHHRSVKLMDLLVAAAAELAGVTVWHYDEDFDRIAQITGQPTLWIARRGSL